MKNLLFFLALIALSGLAFQAPLAGIGIGDEAPSFELKNIDGKMYSFENIRDTKGKKPKGYIMVFTCNTCPYAIANEQRLIELQENFGPKGYPVVAIQPNDPEIKPGDSFAAMKSNADAKGFNFLYLIDEEQSVFPQYGATKTPEVFLLDANRIVRYHGAIDDSVRDADGVETKFVENAIAAIENGQEPSPSETKSIGCGIKKAR
ncbi:MAG: thioredoxin family protein [Bacteroidota bacterium]